MNWTGGIRAKSDYYIWIEAVVYMGVDGIDEAI